MDNYSSNNKRIAKNTLLLYLRMFVTMALSLYTSRLVLKFLGVDDYGIYNVVGGVVGMFSILSYSFSSSISRFITYELGKRDSKRLSCIFSTSVNIQIAISIIVVLIAEVVGVWFLNNKMTIPTERLNAANWVLQFSIATFVINLISVPYNAAMIAHEKMKAFAYVTIVEVVLKLLVVYVLFISPIDKLTTYASLLFCVSLFIRTMYSVYCRRHFDECTYHFVYDKCVIKDMTSFAGWNLVGATSAVLRDQGVNIVINLFCGPAVNAARGVATQVNNAVCSFIQSFMTALNPQVTKSYASGNKEYMMTLIRQGARLSFYLLLLISIPIIVEADRILDIWLGVVPDYTVDFVRLILVFSMVEALSIPLITAMYATGNIKNYQIVVGSCQMFTFPLSYLALYCQMSPQWTFVAAILISVCCLLARLYMLKGMIGLCMREFIFKVVVNVARVSALSIIVPVIIHYYMEPCILRFVIVVFVSVLLTVGVIYFVGCSREERSFVYNRAIRVYRKVLRRNND